MNLVKAEELLHIYERIDLYRAKYRHADFTPHAWCFHGGKQQGWVGSISNNKLALLGGYTYLKGLNIDASVYKYITTKLYLPMPRWTPPTSTQIVPIISYKYMPSDYGVVSVEETIEYREQTAVSKAYIRSFKGMLAITDWLQNKNVPANNIHVNIVNGRVQISIDTYVFMVAPVESNGVYYSLEDNLNSAWDLYINYLKLVEHDAVLTYQVGETTYTKVCPVLYSQKGYTVLFDMSGEATWTGTVTQINLSIASAIQGIDCSTNTLVEYIKVDQKNVFAEIAASKYATINDFNKMRQEIELIAKNDINWSKPGTSVNPNEVRANKDVINRSDITEARKTINDMAPYNGCSTCDNYTCQCYQTNYGYVPCSTCNGCNTFTSCSSCDKTCYQQAVACSCNLGCYQQPSACGCNQTTY